MAKPGSRDRELSPDEKLEAEIFVLENQVTQYKLNDARMNLLAIKLVDSFRVSDKTFEESMEFVANTTSVAEVRQLFSKYIHAPASRVKAARQLAEKIVKDYENV